jgi:hypothetical protein
MAKKNIYIYMKSTAIDRLGYEDRKKVKRKGLMKSADN